MKFNNKQKALLVKSHAEHVHSLCIFTLKMLLQHFISLTQWFSSAPSTHKRRWRNSSAFEFLSQFGPYAVVPANFKRFFQSLTVSYHSSDQYHVLADSERPFLAEKPGLSVPAESSGAPAKSSGYTFRCSGDLTCGHSRGCRDEAETPQISFACLYGPVDRLPFRYLPVILNWYCGVTSLVIFKPNILLERCCPDLNEHVLFLWIRS